VNYIDTLQSLTSTAFRSSPDVEVVRLRQRGYPTDSLLNQRFEARKLKLSILIKRLLEVSDYWVICKFAPHCLKLGIYNFIRPLRHNLWMGTEFWKREKRFVPFNYPSRVRRLDCNLLNPSIAMGFGENGVNDLP
jgi:hypothetical protein